MSFIVPIFVPTMGSAAAPFILFSGNAINILSSVGTPAGQAFVGGRFGGTVTWSLTNNSSGVYAINSATGAVTIASTTNLAVETETITIAVSGTNPAVTSRSFTITVQSSAAPVTATGQYFWLGF